MGIKKFTEIEELYDIIERDLASSFPSDVRYPVRFIFLDTFRSVNDLVSFLKKRKIEVLELSSWLPFEDGWFTPDDIVRAFKEIKRTSVIVLLSEFLRFQDSSSFYAIIKGITEIESQGNFRIYIPLLGLWEKFEKDFWKNFYRSDAWAPIWKFNGNTKADKMMIYQVDFPLDTLPKNSVKVCNTTEWLNLWKIQKRDNVFCFSKPISSYCHHFLPDSIFSLKEIKNQKDFLKYVLNIDIPIEFKPFEAGYWEKLIDFCYEKNFKSVSFNNIFSAFFNLMDIENLNIRDYLKLFLNEHRNFSKWMVRNFFLSRERFKASYLSLVLSEFEGTKELDFIKEIWCKIFEMNKDESLKYASERKDLLNFLHRDLHKPVDYLENTLKKRIEGIKSFPLKDQFALLTGISKTERKHIVELYHGADSDPYMKGIRQIYPELFDYLNWNETQPQEPIDIWVKEYLAAYTASKVANVELNELSCLLDEKNLDKGAFADWYYKINKPNLGDKKAKFVWVDGLGAEWFLLFSNLIVKYGKDRGKYIAKSGITKVSLPTVTECNKYDYLKVDDLDNYVHQENPYKHPDCLVDEIEIIDKIVQKIIDMQDERIVIISDHGFTFLCTKDFGNFKKLNFSESNHEGRCMWLEKEVSFQDDKYFIIWQSDEGPCKGKKSLVALKHVSLFNTPYREVHGGATPEEVLVPYFVIETIDEKISYKISPKSFEISVKNPVIKVSISPSPFYDPEVAWRNRIFKVEYVEEEGLYEINLKGLRTGFHEIVLKLGNKSQKINVNIKGGFTERELI